MLTYDSLTRTADVDAALDCDALGVVRPPAESVAAAAAPGAAATG